MGLTVTIAPVSFDDQNVINAGYVVLPYTDAVAASRRDTSMEGSIGNGTGNGALLTPPSDKRERRSICFRSRSPDAFKTRCWILDIFLNQTSWAQREEYAGSLASRRE